MKDKYETLGLLLADVGGELAQIVGGDPDGIYVYAEAGDGWIGISVYKDEGDVVRYFDPSSELTDMLLEAWNAEEPAKRWSVMEYEVNGTKFDVRFKFPDEVDVKSFADDDRRDSALKRRFGDKPVIYPPWPHAQD